MELKEKCKCSINDNFITINISKEMQNSISTLKSGHQIATKNYIRWQ